MNSIKNSIKAQPISRKSLAWLLVVQIFILAPHFFSVPIWIVVVWGIVAIWRWRIFQGAWSYPNKLQKTLLVAVCCVGLFLSLGGNFRFESMLSLLLVGFILKLLELKNNKDFVLLIFIALFVLAGQFIQLNNFLAALYGFVCLVLLCTALMLLYKQPVTQNLWRDIRPSFYILLQAIPFMIILFVVMPRIGSFWGVPSPQQTKTGMSDSMSPGDFATLMESDELAFRVTFTGTAPPREKLYWRSLVFSSFDGRRWSQTNEQKPEGQFGSAGKQVQPYLGYKDNQTEYKGSQIEYEGDQVEYNLIAEASGQRWLYSLAAPKSWSGNIGFSRDMYLYSFRPLNDRISYHVKASLNYQLNEIGSEELAQNKLIPKNGNLKTRVRAKEWLAETGSPEKLIEKLFAYYNKSFFYTLKPPVLGVDVVDDFLWSSRQGFCEYFASSFVYFMRAAGVPARVVVGYQGGDINSVNGSLTVRQRDAHAWAEVWLEGRGWVLFDPTAAVAPERVQKGIEQSLSATDRQRLAKPFGGSFKILLRMREQWDAANLTWVRWVMNYDAGLQASLLEQLLGRVSPLRIAVFVIIAGSCLGIILFMLLMLRNSKQHLPETSRIYFQLCKKLGVGGFTPLISETPRQFGERVILLRPELSVPLTNIINLYEQLAYADNTEAAKDLQNAIRELSLKS